MILRYVSEFVHVCVCVYLIQYDPKVNVYVSHDSSCSEVCLTLLCRVH